MKTSLTLWSALTLFPAIALGVFVSVLTPAWLLPPAFAFAVFLLVIGTTVRFFGLVVGFVLRLIVWALSAGMLFAAIYAIALDPHHSLLAWIVVLTAVVAILSTPPRRPRTA